MEVLPELIAGVEVWHSGTPITHCPREPGKRQSLLVAQRGAAREHDLERAQKDHTMRTRAGL